MKKRSRASSFLFIVLLVMSTGYATAKHGEHVFIAGWLEHVVLSPWQIKLRAKLDTGAKTSSLGAQNITLFEKEGAPWVRFELPQGKNKVAIRDVVETPLVREALIKRHNMEPSKRPVIKLAFCINAHFFESEFTLANRTNYNYPVLLGRRFLEDTILVDSSSTFMHSNKFLKQNCQKLTKIKSVLHQ